MKKRNDNQKPLDLEQIRKRLDTTEGKQYWRSLEELAETEEFQDFLHNEFPHLTELWDAPVKRRSFLKFMGASLALAGLNACTKQPTEKIFPYVRAPEEIIPGKPLFFATSTALGGYATGVLVESHMGRPTKIEGNPDHPASLGSTDSFTQAAILSLYDPDRSQVVVNAGQISTWDSFLTAIATELEAQRGKKGAGIRILTETVTSPSLAAQIRELLQQFPEAKWHQYDPVARDSAMEGAKLAFGEYVETRYYFDKADVVLSLDANFLFELPGSVRYARDFTSRRRAPVDPEKLNRLYAVESSPAITGAAAEHRLPLRASEIPLFAQELAHRLGVAPQSTEKLPSVSAHEQLISALVADLQSHRGSSLVVAGEYQPPVVHYLAHAMNQALGNVGKTLDYIEPVAANPVNQMESLRELVRDMSTGSVELLVMLGGNPVFTAPADLEFDKQFAKVKTRVHLNLYNNETSFLCHWHIPEAHTLESWGDARAFDGTTNLIQPLIAPLFGGKTAHELVSVLRGQPGISAHDVVQGYWQKRHSGKDFEKFWRISLHDGVVKGTKSRSKSVQFRKNPRALQGQPGLAGSSNSLEIIFRPDPGIWDGRFANIGWLQELPKPFTKLTWDNAALVSPKTAQRLNVQNEQFVELTYQGRGLEIPVWILPGHPDDSVTVYFGYGGSRVGKVGNNTGFNAYTIRTSDNTWFGSGLQLKKLDGHYKLAATTHHHSMEHRHLVLHGTVAEFQANPDFVKETIHEPTAEESLYPGYKYEGYKWGMTIDLNACIGCNACVVACQSENNIPVVGKEQVLMGREMQWIRIDTYYHGELENPETYFQPVPCMHCENAPCELVCPVGATVHGDEGLNEMIYNRCVGTRYCSNNCPYKVRRFNFFKFADFKTPVLKLMRNPDVTVRSRGVMEKCTYCVQRINEARIQAEKENRVIHDGEVLTACQQVCPAEAIVFGDLNDSEARVTELKESPLNYGLLAETGTRPRTTYLTAVTNPNPAIPKEDSKERDH